MTQDQRSDNASEKNILVVDDELMNLQVLSDILMESGYEVRAAVNGKTALMTAGAELPDVILLDIQMPDLNGYEVCRKLKSDENTKDIPVIFISALSDISDRVRGFAAGGVDFITKPFQVEEVLARVDIHLRLRQMQKNLERQNLQMKDEIIRRKQAEELVCRLNEDLEKKVIERTGELQREVEEHRRTAESLAKAKAEAEAALRVKSEFIANISHELRTPLNHVVGFSTLLRREQVPNEWRGWAESIQRSGNHLATIVDDLINLADLKAGKIGMTTDRFPIRPFLNGILKGVRIHAEKKGVRLDDEIASDMPEEMTSDIRRLRQILINLLGNGIKFTKKGGRVTLRVRRTEAARGVIRFEVEDTGVGIPSDQLDRIFSAFYQIGNVRKSETEGPGLGLTISQRFLQIMRSALYVHSTVGKGSLFWFEI